VIISQEEIEKLWATIEAAPTTAITVDLDSRTVTYGDVTLAFELDDYTRWRLMEGLDDIGLTLAQEASISAFEAVRTPLKPTTLPIRA
jgi:3-isopropylmalate/(R)-2-methylmalate dehydratase small subunit